MRALEKGRNLVVQFGEDEPESMIEFTVKPVNIETGAALLAQFVSIHAATEDDDPGDTTRIATDMAASSIGDENMERAQSLRADEFRFLTLAAFFWNVTGGGTEALDAYRAGGVPKAAAVVFAAAGLPTMPPSMISPSSASANPTQ